MRDDRYECTSDICGLVWYSEEEEHNPACGG